MNIDLIELLEKYNIEFRTSGSNVSSGNVVVRCPWCEDDPSMHLTVRISDGAYGCWRDPSHRGKNVTFLISCLLGVKYNEAKKILNDMVDFDNVIRNINNYREISTKIKNNESLQLPQGLKNIADINENHSLRVFLKQRGFDNIDLLSRRYGLFAGIDGVFQGCLVHPLTLYSRILNFLIRTDGKNPYIIGTTDKDTYGFTALRNKTELLGFHDHAVTGGKHLFIVEGLTDALKIDYYGSYHSVRAIFTMGIGVSSGQKKLLYGLVPRYKRVYLMYDRGTYHKTLKIASELSYLRIIPVCFEEEFPDKKDPGELTASQIVEKLT